MYCFLYVLRSAYAYVMNSRQRSQGLFDYIVHLFLLENLSSPWGPPIVINRWIFFSNPASRVFTDVLLNVNSGNDLKETRPTVNTSDKRCRERVLFAWPEGKYGHREVPMFYSTYADCGLCVTGSYTLTGTQTPRRSWLQQSVWLPDTQKWEKFKDHTYISKTV